MAQSRLSHALAAGAVALPEEGRIAIFGPAADADLPGIDPARWHVIQPSAPDYAALSARGYHCATQAVGPYAAAVVTLPRARDRAQGWIAEACAATDGPILVDGAKTDGIDAMLKAVRARATIDGQIAKNHGKVFSFASTDAFADWQGELTANRDGYLTGPGVFSADGIDPASAALAEALPEKLGPRVADLGAGWGYLATQILKRDSVKVLHLVEADRIALDCATRNAPDPRAVLHWDDARTWRAPEPLDSVVMNPPFHEGRAADPGLGRAFIATAARILTPGGTLWMVANRHLPYETVLEDAFRDVSELGGDRRFKILSAARPRRAASPSRTRAARA
ncbi:MFS transporter [Roseivivax halodurans JCM 10272]|uniref:MFS transporter n=1 Tax=Roseivivax halodurans JCM 10272 TaxID=1449350 RepID=X7EJG7_9RHOB|nr:class I SAM-dependent methyltransferase [Roseivivax halodurans]ETX16020.1 MFS transporter [Roseivivax halodurans JCM 10272]